MYTIYTCHMIYTYGIMYTIVYIILYSVTMSCIFYILYVYNIYICIIMAEKLFSNIYYI